MQAAQRFQQQDNDDDDNAVSPQILSAKSAAKKGGQLSVNGTNVKNAPPDKGGEKGEKTAPVGKTAGSVIPVGRQKAPATAAKSKPAAAKPAPKPENTAKPKKKADDDDYENDPEYGADASRKPKAVGNKKSAKGLARSTQSRPPHNPPAKGLVGKNKPTPRKMVYFLQLLVVGLVGIILAATLLHFFFTRFNSSSRAVSLFTRIAPIAYGLHVFLLPLFVLAFIAVLESWTKETGIIEFNVERKKSTTKTQPAIVIGGCLFSIVGVQLVSWPLAYLIHGAVFRSCFQEK